MKKQVLLINDLAGYGNVALSAMLPVLTYMGCHVCNLPTALVSNTLDYGKFRILETTDYMRDTLAVWQELDFQFDAISTGFVVSEQQAKLIADFCKQRSADGTMIFVDPIMGDEGSLYNGVTEQTAAHLRELTAVADYVVPNYTEAAYLSNVAYQKDGMSREEAKALVMKLREIGAKSVVITSALVNGEHAVVGFDHRRDEHFLLPFEEIPVRFPGTGDVFSAVLMGKVLAGEPLAQSTQRAMDAVKNMIELNRDAPDKYRGLPISSCLGVIDG
nr:pyridoxamine kinase [uncultured Dysosmobacter sp.]